MLLPPWRGRQDADESWCSLVEIFARKIPKSMLAAVFLGDPFSQDRQQQQQEEEQKEKQGKHFATNRQKESSFKDERS